MNNKENDTKRPLDAEIVPEELEEKVSGGTGINGCYFNTAFGVNPMFGVNMAFGVNTPKFLYNA